MNVRHLTTWEPVLTACQITQNKTPTCKEPSQAFIKKQIRLRHKTLEIKRFEIIAEMPQFVYAHLRAHRDPKAFTGTRRDDLQDKARDPNETVLGYFDVSAEDLLHMAEQRLCRKSHSKTVEVMTRIKGEVFTLEPDLARAMVARCVVEGWCREDRPCGFMRLDCYDRQRKMLTEGRHG
jgi:hypothetical protein